MLVDGFCDTETIDEDNLGIFQWNESNSNSLRTASCPFGPPGVVANRTCMSRLNWTMPSIDLCASIITERFTELNVASQDVSA